MSPNSKDGPTPHHHHNHHHHHHHTSQKPAPRLDPTIPKPKQEIRSHSVLAAVSGLSRYHLGSTFYSTTISPIQSQRNPASTARGYASTPAALPRFEGKENCTFTIRVPRVYLDRSSREEITSRRPVWGTDVYTDDSDVIAACIHGGWIRGEWPDDVDVSLLDLVISPDDSELAAATTTGTTPNKKSKVAADKKFLEAPPRTGPMLPLPDHDLNVTILILPPLQKYTASTRWGMRSRDWPGAHDGMSFMVLSLRWVDGHVAEEGGTAAARRERLRDVLDFAVGGDDDMEDGRVEVENVSGVDVLVKESFLRGGGDDVELGTLKGLGMGGWWTRPRKREASSGGDLVGKKIVEAATQESVVDRKEVPEPEGATREEMDVD